MGEKYTMQAYCEQGGAIVPLWQALTLEYDSIEGMRDLVKAIAEVSETPVHTVTITSEDATVERWIKLDGEWRHEVGA